jgi:hypothetical protein
MTQYHVMIFVMLAISRRSSSSFPAIKVPVDPSKIDQFVAVIKGARVGVARELELDVDIDEEGESSLLRNVFLMGFVVFSLDGLRVDFFVKVGSLLVILY